MKLDAKFKCENKQLYFLDGTLVQSSAFKKISAKDFLSDDLQGSDFFCIDVKFSEVGFDEDSYNEDFLAGLRDSLKVLEEKNKFAFMNPVFDAQELNDSSKENFTASMKHCSRRIKDCENVIGFAVPSEVNSEYFIEELSAKHKHYIFFNSDSTIF